MEPAVDVALLGAVSLVASAAWLLLAGAAVALRGRVRGSAGLLATGAVVLAGVETLSALRFGSYSSAGLQLARAAGLLLLAGATYAGALAPRGSTPSPTASGPGSGTSSAAGVVVPLGAPLGPSLLAAAAGVAATVGMLRSSRDPARLVIAGGLALAAVAAAAAPLAVTDAAGATAVLGLRGAAAVLLLTGLVVLARASLLAKVVAAILTGVLAVAVAAVGAVGTVVARGYAAEQATLVRDAADGRQQLLQQSLDRLGVLAPVFRSACTRSDLIANSCDGVLRQLTEPTAENFAVLLPAQGEPRLLGGRAGLSPAEALGLAATPEVRASLDGGPAAPRTAVPALVRLLSPQPGLAQMVVQALDRPTPQAPAPAVFVYGVRVGQYQVDSDFDRGGFGYTLLAGDSIVASNLAVAERDQVAAIARRLGSLPPQGVTVAAEGSQPTVHLRPLGGDVAAPAATLVLSRGAEQSLRTQRRALSSLLLTVAAAVALVAVLAVLLGRRTVEPVRRLTAAAERVAAGDLAGTAGVGGRDEVGTLARTFDTMTGSLARLTADLRSAAGRLETVLASISDGLVATDAGGRVTSANRAALAMAGRPDATAVLGRPLADVVDLRDPSGRPLPDAVGLRDEPAQVRRADGTSTPIRLAAAPLETGDGNVWVLRDTTREREVERMKTEFLSNVSHELRTPLTPIRGYADLLASRPELPVEKVTAFAGTILAESLKMNRVVDLLVDVAALEAGRVTVTPRAVSPRDLLDGRLQAWRERVPQRATDLRRRAAAGLPAVAVDPEWLGKALDELVDNALKHTPAGTAVTLVASRGPDPGWIRLSVRDVGPGIDAADQELLFTFFEQVDGSSTRRVGGLGLGLSFVRRVAQDAGWRLTVRSARGKGSEFSLDVPVAEPAPGPTRPHRGRRG